MMQRTMACLSAIASATGGDYVDRRMVTIMSIEERPIFINGGARGQLSCSVVPTIKIESRMKDDA